MIRAMKEYYGDVLKPEAGWIRRHWKGYAVFMILLAAAEMLIIFRENIIEFTKSKFKREES